MYKATDLFSSFLSRQDEAAWSRTLAELLPLVHPVDQTATRLWFSFFPLKLTETLRRTENLAQKVKELQLQGNYGLSDQLDTSHDFLYGHGYWPEVKRALVEYAADLPDRLDLHYQILQVARRLADRLSVDVSLLVGITAVAFMSWQQIGYEEFRRAAVPPPPGSRPAKSPDHVIQVRTRKKRNARWFALLKSGRKQFTVTFREQDKDGHFTVFERQEMASGAAMDKRDYKARDRRCIEGPIPVECRSAACGSCWVGVLSGAENLSEPADLEIRRMKEFGYPNFSPDKTSIVRLACQSKCFGDVSIVIPPWNGIIGVLNR